MSNENTAKDLTESQSAADLLEQSERELDKAIGELRGEPGQPAEADAEAPAAPKNTATQRRRASDNPLIMDIPVSVNVVLGSADMRVSELMALNRGSTVVLDRRIGEPVDLVVNGKRIALGEITVIDENTSRLGIRLTDVIDG